MCKYYLLLLCVLGCKEKYLPPAITVKNNFLVVDGFINSGPDSTSFRLTHTINLNDNSVPKPELNALLTVEDEASNKYPLQEKGQGLYSNAHLPLDITKKYRLHIKTAGGKEYMSDFVPVKQTPPIDSISWARVNNGVQIYANTHDPLNNTKYYQWKYDETWEFHTTFFSTEVYQGKGVIVPRDPNKPVNVCWSSQVFTTLLLGSSAKLTKDEIYHSPLVYIPPQSWELSVRYSILVKQFALTKEAYEYWDNVKKNNEQIGSLFDAQPTELSSNIHCVSDPQEPVIGYISVCSLEQKRIFILNSDLPDWGYSMDCEFVTVPNNKDSITANFGGRYLPIDAIPGRTPGSIDAYSGSNPNCVDCTLKGTSVKPSFW